MIYRWKCRRCEVVVDITRPISECNVPPERTNTYTYCLCQADLEPAWTRVYEAPMQLKASYPDGHKRKGWGDLKESAKLEKLAAGSKADTKREIKQEIQKMGIKPGKDGL